MYGSDGLQLCECLVVVNDIQLVMFIVYRRSLAFLDGGNAPIIGLLLLLCEINGENVNSGLCVFGVLQIWYQSQVLIFLMGYGVWSLDIGG